MQGKIISDSLQHGICITFNF